MSELQALLGLQQNLISYHLRELRAAGLVTARRSSRDGRDTYYRVDLDQCAAVLSNAAPALAPGLRLARLPQPSPKPRRVRMQVLFLCTGNSARSQMAEAFLAVRSAGSIRSFSAGSRPGQVHPFAIKVMSERGIDISRCKSKHLSRYSRASFTCVVTLCDKVRELCPGFPGNPETVHWSIADPSATGTGNEARYDSFEVTAADVENRIDYLIGRLSTVMGEAHA